MGLAGMTDDQANEIVAAIRNPDNTGNMVIQDVRIDGVLTKALCWVELDAEGKPILSPLAVLVSPKLFTMVKPVHK